jgi:hypothetical protein
MCVLVVIEEGFVDVAKSESEEVLLITTAHGVRAMPSLDSHTVQQAKGHMRRNGNICKLHLPTLGKSEEDPGNALENGALHHEPST